LFADGTTIIVGFGVGFAFVAGVGLRPEFAFSVTLGFGTGVGRTGVAAVFVVFAGGTRDALAFVSVTAAGTSAEIAPLFQI